MSVHSLDWDEVLNKDHIPKASLLSEDEEAEKTNEEPIESEDGDDKEDQERSVHSLDWDDVQTRKYTPEAMDEELGALAKFTGEDDASSSSSDSDERKEAEEDEEDYQPPPALKPDAWGELFVDEQYEWDWGEPPRDKNWTGYYIDPPVPTPLWRQEEVIAKMPEYKILHRFLYTRGNHAPKVKEAVADIQEATYYVLGLAHYKKLDPFQTNVLLWKHVSNIYRSLFHLAVATGSYSQLVDILVQFQRNDIKIIHPQTEQVVQYEEEDGRLTEFWRDLPGIQSAIFDELQFISHGLGEGDSAASPDPRRTDMEQIIGLTNEIISRCDIERPYKGRRNKSLYLQPTGIEPNPGPRPKPNEWEIRSACYWMIGGVSWLLGKIEENKQTLEEKPELKNDPRFPPWDHGGEVFHYPGIELYVDKYRNPAQWDPEVWREWSKAKGLNEFTDRSWDAWSAGLIAVLDANRQGKYDAFAGGKKLTKETEELVQKALAAMVDAKEQRAAYSKFQEDVAVMSL